MPTSEILSPVTAVLTWPASRFADVRRTYDLTLLPPDVCALIRGGLAVDPLFRPVGDGFAQSAHLEIVGRVTGQRFEIYMSGKFASGIGLVGTVEATSTGSRVITEVGWTGPTKWIMPGMTVLVLIALIAIAPAVPAAISGGGSDAWATVGLGAMCAGGQMVNLVSRARRARNDELPMLFARLESVLAPRVR